MSQSFPAKGRAITLKRGGVPVLIAGVRTKSMTISGSAIDVTTDDDSAVKTLLADPGEHSMSISVSGVTKNDVLRVEAMLTTGRIQPTEFGFPGSLTNGKIAGDFFLTSYQEAGEYQNAATFDATFESAGPLTYTPAT